MPVECTFVLNKQGLPTLHCTGFGSVSAFSGNGRHIDNRDSVAVAGKDHCLPASTTSSIGKAEANSAGSGTA